MKSLSNSQLKMYAFTWALQCKNYYTTSWDENLCTSAGLYNGIIWPKYINSPKLAIYNCYNVQFAIIYSNGL